MQEVIQKLKEVDLLASDKCNQVCASCLLNKNIIGDCTLCYLLVKISKYIEDVY